MVNLNMLLKITYGVQRNLLTPRRIRLRILAGCTSHRGEYVQGMPEQVRKRV